MDKKEAIQFLRAKLGKIPTLAELPYNNDDYPLWRNQIEDVLEGVFNLDSTEYQRFAEAHPTRPRTSSADRSAEKRWYLDEVKMRKTAILSIIKKHELLGVEDKPAEKAQQKDTVKLPLQLFDAMQFHPKIINASRALFEDEYYAQAIFEAFKAVENFVQDKSDLNLYGTNLMETVFNEENPIIKVPEAGHYYKDVQRGFKHLFIGASQGIRNPKAHKEIIQKDPYITLQYLGFFSFLLKRIDYWEAGVS